MIDPNRPVQPPVLAPDLPLSMLRRAARQKPGHPVNARRVPSIPNPAARDPAAYVALIRVAFLVNQDRHPEACLPRPSLRPPRRIPLASLSCEFSREF